MFHVDSFHIESCINFWIRKVAVYEISQMLICNLWEKEIFLNCYHHLLRRNTFTTRHRPPPKIESYKDQIQRISATFTRKSIHLVDGLHMLRLRIRGHHTNTLWTYAPSALRAMWPSDYRLSLAILWAFRISKSVIQFRKELRAITMERTISPLLSGWPWVFLWAHSLRPRLSAVSHYSTPIRKFCLPNTVAK